MLRATPCPFERSRGLSLIARISRIQREVDADLTKSYLLGIVLSRRGAAQHIVAENTAGNEDQDHNLADRDELARVKVPP